MSDLTSKFFPSGQPPWQVHVINCFLRGEEYQICLVRVHHLLLRQEHLVLADFLPLRCSTDSWACQETDSPFTNLYSEPSALPKLYQKLTESFSNYWNEFLCNNDPNERPEILKRQIGIFQCSKIGVIVLVSSLKEMTRYSAEFLLIFNGNRVFIFDDLTWSKIMVYSRKELMKLYIVLETTIQPMDII